MTPRRKPEQEAQVLQIVIIECEPEVDANTNRVMFYVGKGRSMPDGALIYFQIPHGERRRPHKGLRRGDKIQVRADEVVGTAESYVERPPQE